MKEKNLMLSGKLYKAADDELKQDFLYARKITRQINLTAEDESEKRQLLFKQLFKSTGNNFYIEPPFHCDYGKNISIGENFYANYDCIIIDVCNVNIGNNVFLAPRVCIYTAAHPIDAEVRNTGLEYGKEINIGNNVWVCGNVVINPGVTIGDNVVIGSGAVVTKNIPSDVVAAGNPCKVIRKITGEDKLKWHKLAQEYFSSK